MIQLERILYSDYEIELPQEGKHIIGSETQNGVIVYQAYNPSIGEFAIKNQFFGGDFKLSRMSWIKTNFLWMMYRSGWATKVGQEYVLAIEIHKEAFKKILKEAVQTSFNSKDYQSIDIWKNKIESSCVRLQWDPDHMPKGEKLKRKAMQIGLKGEFLKKYSNEWILSINDITPFVKQQRKFLDKNEFDKLIVIKEKVISVIDFN